MSRRGVQGSGGWQARVAEMLLCKFLFLSAWIQDPLCCQPGSWIHCAVPRPISANSRFGSWSPAWGPMNTHLVTPVCELCWPPCGLCAQ